MTAAGDGAITFSKTGSEPSSTPSKVVSASCKTLREKKSASADGIAKVDLFVLDQNSVAEKGARGTRQCRRTTQGQIGRPGSSPCSAMAVALVGGLSLFNLASRDTKSPTVVSAPHRRLGRRSRFEAEAHRIRQG